MKLDSEQQRKLLLQMLNQTSAQGEGGATMLLELATAIRSASLEPEPKPAEEGR